MLHDLPIPIWAIVLILIVVTIPTYVLIAGRKAGGGFRGRTSHGWSRWREMSQKAANVQARVLLTIFYFTMMLPFGIVMGLLKDPLRIKQRPSGSYWVERKPTSGTLADAKRQF